MRHTSGPWQYAPKSAQSANIGIYTADGDLLATVQRSGSALSAERREADARLMAAAPRLLEALRDLLSLVEPLIDEETDARAYRLDEARAAIVAAELDERDWRHEQIVADNARADSAKSDGSKA